MVQETKPQNSSPDYANLVRFLMEPFLESPNLLRVDCELSQGNLRVWIRLAFEGADKGRVFGRGGRNIQALRTVITAAAQAAGQSVHLDVYGGLGQHREFPSGDKPVVRKSPDRPVPSKPISRSNPR